MRMPLCARACGMHAADDERGNARLDMQGARRLLRIAEAQVGGGAELEHAGARVHAQVEFAALPTRLPGPAPGCSAMAFLNMHMNMGSHDAGAAKYQAMVKRATALTA